MLDDVWQVSKPASVTVNSMVRESISVKLVQALPNTDLM